MQGDENPKASAERVLQFLGDDASIPSIDLGWLENVTTMFGGFGTMDVTPDTNRTDL